MMVKKMKISMRMRSLHIRLTHATKTKRESRELTGAHLPHLSQKKVNNSLRSNNNKAKLELRRDNR